MKLLSFFLASLLFLFSSFSALADMKIYHWVDENGKIHFSDTATPGTDEVEVKMKNLLSLPKAEKKTALNAIPSATDKTKVINYQTTITSPEHDMPLRSNNGTIEIYVKTSPEKENSHKLQLYLDGKKLGDPQISSVIKALNIDRGTHQVQVHLIDEEGKLLAKTQVVTVHLMRATVK